MDGSSKKTKLGLVFSIITPILVLALIGCAAFLVISPKLVEKPERGVSLDNSFEYVFTIVEENEGNSVIIGNPDAPYINELARKYSLGTNYHAVTHPSLPNYIAMTSGITDKIQGNCNPPSNSCQVDTTNITDLLEEKGISWKSYFESMPKPCDTTIDKLYNVQHNPFVYYPSIYKDKFRCDHHIVPYKNLEGDLSLTDTTPRYAFIVPNMCNDMHDCGVSQGDKWLSQEVPKILGSPAFINKRSILIITWDESEINAAKNKVPIIFIGQGVKRENEFNEYFDHFSYLKTLSDIFNVKISSPKVEAARSMLSTFESK